MREVISVLNMRESDSYTIKNFIPSKELMYKAALGISEAYSYNGKTCIFCGSGNNAGDGYALALILHELKKEVLLVLVSEKFSDDGLYYFNKCKEANIPYLIYNRKMDLTSYDTFVDALLGTGFKGSPRDNYKSAINYLNLMHDKGKFIISADINSGLNGDTGMGEVIVKSNLTVSIGYLKTGLFLNMAKDYIGKVLNKDIGIKALFKPYFLIEESDLKEFFKPRLNFSNKGNYGYVGIMGGSYEYPGAPRLANLGQTSLYSGSGVSKLIVPDSIYDLIFNNVLETTIARMPSASGKMIFDPEVLNKEVLKLKALGVGVGWGENFLEYSKILSYLFLNYEGALVIDADGLNTLSQMDLSILNQSKAKIILTPHLKEFSRLIKKSIKEINDDSINLVKDFVNKYQVTLLLKGPTTIIANRDNLYLVDRGTSGMATAGSGDVLTGILVGFLGRYQDDVTLTSSIAAYVNGKAGELAKLEYGDMGMVSSDTLRCVSKVLKDF